jgi:hypothetical protein
MRGITAFVLCTAVFATACNAIVGVEDVKQKSALSAQKPKPAAGQDTTGDSAGADSQKGPNGDPVKPEGETGGGLKITASPECNGTPNCKRLAFVTRETFTGDLGGLAGADQKCFAAAKTIPGFGGRAFRAWLSDTTGGAKARLPKGTGAYRRTDDGVVATTFTDLSDGDVALPIALDQKGTMLDKANLERSVWTGTTVDGADSTFNCFDWTSADVMQSGTYGDSQATDSTWTDSATSSCNASRHLYCVEY